jgi:predicted TIM-barrel fold metal-dependent hydrolase
VLPDDELLHPIWEAAGRLQLPVLIHVADPIAFFAPVDRHNERLEELRRNRSASKAGVGVAGFHRLLESLDRLVGAHPATLFVGAHMASFAENLAWVSDLLDRHPNLLVDVSARAAELGRQPRAAAALIRRHADRVLFGTDAFPIDPAVYSMWFRLLETADEAFDYSNQPIPPTGRWTVSGLDLELPILQQVYAANARRVLRLGGAGP